MCTTIYPTRTPGIGGRNLSVTECNRTLISSGNVAAVMNCCVDQEIAKVSTGSRMKLGKLYGFTSTVGIFNPSVFRPWYWLEILDYRVQIYCRLAAMLVIPNFCRKFESLPFSGTIKMIASMAYNAYIRTVHNKTLCFPKLEGELRSSRVRGRASNRPYNPLLYSPTRQIIP